MYTVLYTSMLTYRSKHYEWIIKNNRPLRAEHSVGQAVFSVTLPVYGDAVHRQPLAPLNPALIASDNNHHTVPQAHKFSQSVTKHPTFKDHLFVVRLARLSCCKMYTTHQLSDGRQNTFLATNFFNCVNSVIINRSFNKHPVLLCCR